MLPRQPQTESSHREQWSEVWDSERQQRMKSSQEEEEEALSTRPVWRFRSWRAPSGRPFYTLSAGWAAEHTETGDTVWIQLSRLTELILSVCFETFQMNVFVNVGVLWTQTNDLWDSSLSARIRGFFHHKCWLSVPKWLPIFTPHLPECLRIEKGVWHTWLRRT